MWEYYFVPNCKSHVFSEELVSLQFQVNIVFLCNILRIILCKLHAKPSNSSTARRGLKAALMLTPLFGLHALLVIYSDVDNVIYEYFSCVLRNSQVCCALIELKNWPGRDCSFKKYISLLGRQRKTPTFHMSISLGM